MTIAATAVAPVHVARIEVQAASVVRKALEGRTRQIVAVGADIADRSTIAIAGCRQEYTVAVAFTCYFITIYAILCSPSPCAIIS